jgi:hypothetical protein
LVYGAFLSLTPAPPPFSTMKFDVGGVSKLHPVLVGEDLWGSPRQPSSHVMIVVMVVVMIVMNVMMMIVMVVMVLFGEC